MSTLVTTGRPRSDGHKDYEICRGAERYVAERVGSRWKCRQRMFSSIKAVKAAILAGELENAASQAASEPESESAARGTWDCCDPAAMLLMVWNTISSDDRRAFSPTFLDELRRTLDSHGYVTPEGDIDMDSALKEYRRAEKYNRRESEGADTESSTDQGGGQ